MLHIVNKTAALAGCLRMARPGDALLLVEDGVFAATTVPAAASGLAAAAGTLAIHVLQPDAAARGMAGRLIDGVRPVDYAGFVDLVAEHPNNQSWL